jgi:hypothetical protein
VVSAWKVREHGDIVEITDNLWTVEAPTPRLPIPRRMVAVKLSTGELVIHSAIAMDDQAMARLEAWGTPAYLIVPNGFHRLDAPGYAERYPDITVVCPTAVRAKVEKKVRVDGGLDALPDDPALQVVTIGGGKADEAALVVDSGGDRTAVFCDALFNLVKVSGLNPLGWVIRLLGSTGGPKVTWIGKRALVADRQAFADSLREIAGRGLTRLIPGHGDLIEADGTAVLERVADKLAPARDRRDRSAETRV